MQKNATGRQQEIIQASLSIMAESGIQSLTIKNLANRIGFAESAIYRHYENKIQILLAILDFFKQHSVHFFEDQLSSTTSSSMKIELLFMNHFRKFAENPSLVAVIFSEEIFRNEIELTEKVREIMKHNLDSLQMIVVAGQTEGELRNDVESTHLAVMLMGSLRMFVKQWHMSNNAFNLVESGSAFVQSVITLIKK